MPSHTPASASSARPERKMVNAAERRLFWGTAVAVVVSDFATKLIAESLLARRLPLAVIGDVVQFRLVFNEGAAFGLHVGDNSRWIFLGLAIIALFVLASLVRGTRPGDRFRLLALALVCGGAVGNLIDRIRSAQGVVDFVDVGIGAWRWPTFNVADSAITIGAIALGLSLWQEGRAQQRAKEARAAEPRTSRFVLSQSVPNVSTNSSPTSSRFPEPRPDASSPTSGYARVAKRCVRRPSSRAGSKSPSSCLPTRRRPAPTRPPTPTCASSTRTSISPYSTSRRAWSSTRAPVTGTTPW